MRDHDFKHLIRDAYEGGKIRARKKCCGKCAFRANSLERCDPYGWKNGNLDSPQCMLIQAKHQDFGKVTCLAWIEEFS